MNKPIVNLALRAYCIFLAACTHVVQPIVLLLFRLHWGWQFYLSGKGKLMNHERVTEFFTSLGIPMPGANAWFVGCVECFGGLLLLVGLFSRPVALILTGNMLVAYLSVESDRAALFGLFSDPETFIAAEPFFYLTTAAIVLAFGPGLISLDALISQFIAKRWGKEFMGGCCKSNSSGSTDTPVEVN